MSSDNNTNINTFTINNNIDNNENNEKIYDSSTPNKKQKIDDVCEKNIDKIDDVYTSEDEKFETNKIEDNLYDKLYEMKNLCVECGIDMGYCNPRQYCGKTYCMYNKYN